MLHAWGIYIYICFITVYICVCVICFTKRFQAFDYTSSCKTRAPKRGGSQILSHSLIKIWKFEKRAFQKRILVDYVWLRYNNWNSLSINSRGPSILDHKDITTLVDYVWLIYNNWNSLSILSLGPSILDHKDTTPLVDYVWVKI